MISPALVLAALMAAAPAWGATPARGVTPARGAAPAAGAEAASPFDQANGLYEASRFSQAAKLYRNILRRRPDDPAVHFNLGNACFREGSLGRAIASYLRAFELDPRDADIRHNLDLALRRAGESLVPPGTPGALFVLFHVLSDAELAGLHWVFCWLTLLLASLYVLREPWRHRLGGLLVATVFCWALFGSWWGLRRAVAMSRPAVVVTHEAEVRSGPGLNFPVSFKTPEGRRVARIDAKGKWIEIGVPKEGLKGWVSAEDIEKL